MDDQTAKRVLVIAGPTGSGESTVTRELIGRFDHVCRTVTATTRAPRLNEQEGVDYYFLSEEQFLRDVETNVIFEHTFIPERGVYYGAYRPDFEKRIAGGYTIIVNPDIVGARYFKEHYDATTIFIAPESLEVLRNRLIKRDAAISSEELEARLAQARVEIEEQQGFYDVVIVNKDGQLEETISQVVSVARAAGYVLAPKEGLSS